MCCCLKTKFLKVGLIVGGALLVILGILALVGASRIQSINKDLFPEDAQKYRKLALQLVYIPGGFLILLGLSVAAGSYKQWKVLLVIFAFFTIIIFFICVACAIVGIVANKYISMYLGNADECFKSTLLKDANQVFINFKFIYCRAEVGKFTYYDIPQEYLTSGLAMKVPLPKRDGQYHTTDQSVRDYLTDHHVPTEDLNLYSDVLCTCKGNKEKIKSLTSDQDIIQKRFGDTLSGISETEYENIMQCPKFDQLASTFGISQSVFDMAKLLIQQIEKQFSCTGVCRGDLIYYFQSSYSEDNFPKNQFEGCYISIRKFLDKIIKILLVGGIVLSFFTLVMVIMTCSLVCKPKEEQNKMAGNQNQQQGNQQELTNMSYRIDNKLL